MHPSAPRLCVALIAAAFAASPARAAKDVELKFGVLPGLKFDVPRFTVEPGANVKITFHNNDQMIHNFVVTEPGARNEVVMAALQLGADGPAKNFIPDTKKVLFSTKALAPGDTATLTFTAPSTEGVYPYVCTYTGHGFVMFGAMYVTTKPDALPPLDADPNVPPPAAQIADMSDHSKHALDRPVVSRTFLPDCGPAAIAIGLPGGQAYVFDAGACRLRYAWKNGFIDNNEHWAGKGDAWGKVVGRVYYRAPGYFPIRIGDVNKQPQVQWKGYAIDKAGYPQLRYTVDGVEVRETPHARTDGIDFTYEIASAPGDVYFVTDPEAGAAFSATAGQIDKGILRLTGEQARKFTLSLTEKPNVEPIGYWSMNDVIFPQREDPKPGVVGRSFTPGVGKKPQALDSFISTAELKNGGTLIAWVKLEEPKKSEPKKAEAKKKPADPAKPTSGGVQPVFSAGDMVIAATANDHEWHQLAIVFASGKATRYIDGVNKGAADVKLPATDANIIIGSIADKTFLTGQLDEVRIYNRPLDDAEIQKVYRKDKAAGQTPR